MTTITPAAHRTLDYLTVLLLLLGPLLFGLTGGAARLSYALAAVHILLTLVTNFSGSGRGVVPYRAHVLLEIVVGAALVFLGLYTFPAALTFYWLMAALILAVVFVSFRGTVPAREP